MLEVIGTDEFADWYGKLSEDAACGVTKAIAIVESAGLDNERVCVIEIPAALRVPQAARGVPRPLSFKLPASLRELSVEGAPYRVLFAVENDGARIVLLYGYDASREGVDSSVGLPPVAHILLAARVYGIYKKEAA
jgi:hypothetical protein